MSVRDPEERVQVLQRQLDVEREHLQVTRAFLEASKLMEGGNRGVALRDWEVLTEEIEGTKRRIEELQSELSRLLCQ